MKIYKWQGKGHYTDATVICTADCLESAKEIISKELIDQGLLESWEETEELEELTIEDCRVIYIDKGV